MSEIFDIEEVIRILGLEIRAEQADEGRNFDVACRVALNKLQKCKKYEDLEEQGLLLRLPCKGGDTVYTVVNECKGDSAGCYRTCDNCNNRRLGIEETKFSIDIIDEIGNWYFLTQSEAEEKLRELEGK